MDTDEPSSRTGIKATAIIVGSVIFYVLSIGPIARYYDSLPTSMQQGVEWFYTPVIILNDYIPGQPINKYAAWWEK